MDRLKLFIPLIVFMVLAPILYWGLGRDPQAMPSALISSPVPAFELPALATLNDDARQGAGVSPQLLSEKIFKGRVSLLNVWATWCVSCRVEHPYLLSIAEKGVPIIGLNYKDEPEEAGHWLRDYGNPYEQTIADRKGSLGLDLGVFGAPETYLIDHLGVIRYKHIGVVDDRVWASSLAPRYAQLLEAASASQ